MYDLEIFFIIVFILGVIVSATMLWAKFSLWYDFKGEQNEKASDS